jgi:hypothetical protein
MLLSAGTLFASAQVYSQISGQRSLQRATEMRLIR